MTETSRPTLAYSKDAEDQVFRAVALKTGGGDGTSGGMEARVSRLETDMREALGDLKEIRVTLAEIAASVRGLPTATDFAETATKVKDLPTAREFGKLEGALSRIPGTPTIATLIAIAVGAITILNNWPAVKSFFSHL